MVKTLSRTALIVASAMAVMLFTPGAWAEPASIPDFSLGGSGWTLGGIPLDFIPVPGSPSPVTSDPAHPIVNGINEGKQPTFRIGDVSNPNLKPWVKEVM